MAKAAKSATQKAGTSPSRKLAVKKDTLKDLMYTPAARR